MLLSAIFVEDLAGTRNKQTQRKSQRFKKRIREEERQKKAGQKNEHIGDSSGQNMETDLRNIEQGQDAAERAGFAVIDRERGAIARHGRLLPLVHSLENGEDG